MQCVTWFIESHSITTVRRNIRTVYQRNGTTRLFILRWMQNFELHGNVENRNASGQHPVSRQTIQTVLKCFTVHSRRSLRRTALDVHLPRSTIHHILEQKFTCFRTKSGEFSNCDRSTWLKRSNLLLVVSIASILIDRTSEYRFFRWMCLSHIWNWEQSKREVLGFGYSVFDTRAWETQREDYSLVQSPLERRLRHILLRQRNCARRGLSPFIEHLRTKFEAFASFKPSILTRHSSRSC